MDIYRSPSIGTPAAATTPARLAREFDHVLWRETHGGEIEVAIRRKEYVDRLIVHSDGSTTEVGRVTIPPRAAADTVAVTGFALAVIGVALAFAGFDPAVLALFGIGVVLFFVGLVRLLMRGEWHSPLGARSDWHKPTDLHGWMPQSVAQLVAVEHIADEHDGLALVHDVGAATIDVRAPRRGGLDCYRVDFDGRVEPTGSAVSGIARTGNRLMPLFAAVLFLGFPILGAHWHGPGVAVGVAAGVGSVIWLSRQRPEERLKRDTAGERWVEIRTQIDDSD